MRRFAAVAGVLVLLVACSSGEPELSDQDVRLGFIGSLADFPTIDDDEARCLGRTMAERDGGADFVRDAVERIVETHGRLEPGEDLEMLSELARRLRQAANICGVPERDIEPVLLPHLSDP